MMPKNLRAGMAGLMICAAGPAAAVGPPGLPNPDAVVLTGIYHPAARCGHVRMDDGRRVFLPGALHGIDAGARVTVRGERFIDNGDCEGPVLVLRGWEPAAG